MRVERLPKSIYSKCLTITKFPSSKLITLCLKMHIKVNVWSCQVQMLLLRYGEFKHCCKNMVAMIHQTATLVKCCHAWLIGFKNYNFWILNFRAKNFGGKITTNHFSQFKNYFFETVLLLVRLRLDLLEKKSQKVEIEMQENWF